MPEHWRLGRIERWVLEALDRLGARPDRPHVKSARAVDLLTTDFGVSPRYGYDALCSLSQPWLQNIRLVDFHGNNGSPDDEPAGPRYTEARLSAAGALALAGERGIGPALPIALINGDLHVDGTAPPFSVTRVTATLLALADGAALADREIIERVGPPESPTGCGIACDYRALGAGNSTALVMSARMHYETYAMTQALVLTHLPFGVGVDRVTQALAERVEALARREPDWHPDDLGELALPLRDVVNMSHGPADGSHDCIVCIPGEGVRLEDHEAQIAATWGVTVRKAVQLPAPLPDLMRELADQDPAALRTALGALSGV